MNKKWTVLFLLLSIGSMGTTIEAQRFGKLDNLFEYILKGQADKYEKNRVGMKPKEIDPFVHEIAYADQLKKVVFESSTDSVEHFYNAYVKILAQPYKSNMELLCTSLKIRFDSLKILADGKILSRLQQSSSVVVQGKSVLAAMDKTSYPVTESYRKVLTDMVFNAQYNDLLTAPTLGKYRAFIVDWPSVNELASVKQNYDDALFAESKRVNNHDLYLMDNVLPNETKKHLLPDDWSLYGDKFSDKSDYTQAVIMYNKAIQLGSKEGLFKLTQLKHLGKVTSDEDELIVFQKLAAIGDQRAINYVQQIQHRIYSLAVEGSLTQLINAKDKARIVSLKLSGSLNAKDMVVLREMATIGTLVTLDLTETTLSKLNDEVLKGCTRLTSLKLPQQLRSIGNESLADCISLTTLVLPDSLTEVMGNSFDRCLSLTSLNIPASLIRGPGYVTFCAGCSKLNQFSVDDDNPVYSALDGVLYNKDKTILYRYPCGKESGLFSLPNTVVEIGTGAFESSVFLAAITLPESLNRLKNNAFKGCTRLVTLNLPSTVSEIGSFAFENCNKLTTLTLPALLTEINYSLFKNCSSLSQVILPESIKEIRSEAFLGCSSLIAIALNGEVKGLGDNCFSGCSGLREIRVAHANPLNVPSIFKGVDMSVCTLNVPLNSKPVYQQFPVWKDFTNIIEVQ